METILQSCPYALSQADEHDLSTLSIVLLAFGMYYTMAVLVQLHRTTLIRLALLPVVLWATWLTMYLNIWKTVDSAQMHANSTIASFIVVFAGRCIAWAFVREPFRRFPLGETNGVPNGIQSSVPMNEGTNIRKTLWDACDLVLNIRGIGWSWSCSRYARYGPPQSRIGFLFKSLARIACNALCADMAAEIARALLPANTAGQLTILDPTLPLPQRLLHASILSGTFISVIYFMVEVTYYTVAFFFVAVFGHAPEQWPPVFDAPWQSTSVGDFWGKRWHQFLRDYAVSLGSQPLTACLATRTFASATPPSSTTHSHTDKTSYGATRTKRDALSILGAFFLSGVLHDITFRSQGKGGKPIQMIGFFVMQGVGVVLERAFFEKWGHTRLFERPRFWHKVVSHVWVLAWLLAWGLPFVDTSTRAGLFNAQLFPEPIKPLRLVHIAWDRAVTTLVGFASHFL